MSDTAESREPGSRVEVTDSKGILVGDYGKQVNQFFNVVPRKVEWPVRVGSVPKLASAFQDRLDLRKLVVSAREGRGGVVLVNTIPAVNSGDLLSAAGLPRASSTEQTGASRVQSGVQHGFSSAQVLSGIGGTGKTQLAAWYARQAIAKDTQLVVWVSAVDVAGVIGAYASAAVRLGLPPQPLVIDASQMPPDVTPPEVSGRRNVEDQARLFLDWLSTADKSWLVVLDDITDPQQVLPWWPDSHTGTGWVLATTRRRDAVLTGGGRTLIPVDTYTRKESISYLTQRLPDEGATDAIDEVRG